MATTISIQGLTVVRGDREVLHGIDLEIDAGLVTGLLGPSGGGNLILRIDSKDAADFAYMADNTQMYFVIRPVVGAKRTKPTRPQPLPRC